MACPTGHSDTLADSRNARWRGADRELHRGSDNLGCEVAMLKFGGRLDIWGVGATEGPGLTHSAHATPWGARSRSWPSPAGTACRRTTMRRRLLAFRCEVPVVWSFLYLALGRVLELVMLCFRSAAVNE